MAWTYGGTIRLVDQGQVSITSFIYVFIVQSYNLGVFFFLPFVII